MFKVKLKNRNKVCVMRLSLYLLKDFELDSFLINDLKY